MDSSNRLLHQKVLVTAGATYEPIDPVRFIGNRSSGKQGVAIARAYAAAEADVVLVAGVVQPALLENLPKNITVKHATTADAMLAAVLEELPCNIAVCVAAVSDWKVANAAPQKIKKTGNIPPTLTLTENPDILRTICAHPNRPDYIIGFAAETENVVENAKTKLTKKGCDCIVANSVAQGKTFAEDTNSIYVITSDAVQAFPSMSKEEVAGIIQAQSAKHLGN